MPKSPIRVVTVIMAFKHKNEEEIRLRLNWLQTDSRNDFSENGGVWLLLQIRSNWKCFPVDQIWEPKQRKWFSISISTSNYFLPWKIEERERERERERGREKESIATSSAGAVALIAIDASIFARCVDLRAIAIDSSRECVDCDRAKRRLLWSRSRRSRSRLRLSEFDDFFLGFVCVLRNKWYYIFVW